jgi:type II secretion system protein N
MTQPAAATSSGRADAARTDATTDPGGWRARLARAATVSGGAPMLLYAAYTAVAFLLCLVATFPHEAVVRQLVARAATGPVAVEMRGLHLGWTLAYTIDELRLLKRDGDPTLPLLSAASVRVAPSLLSLLRGHPYPVRVAGDLYGGTVEGTVDLRPASFAIDTRLAGIDVGRYSGLRLFMEGALRGKVDGELQMEGNPEKPATTNGRLALRAATVALEGGKLRGITVPDLHFPEIRLAGDVKRGRLELGDVAANGNEVVARGEGNVVLQHPLAASVMNLTLAVRPAAGAPDALRIALNLLPGTPSADGEKTIRLHGTLERPRVQ